jgi:lipopolysaccharide assembly outer membrane protein LptD (OstA)
MGAAVAAAAGMLVPTVDAATGGSPRVEMPAVPSVHMTLSPTSAIQAPLRFAADETAVWRENQEQHLLLTGHVTVSVGYRQLKADGAAVWLTPSREGGATAFDVAIYLSGNVEVREGESASSTVTGGKELLVTTRVSQNIQLAGTPVSRDERESPLVKRGAEIRNDLLTRKIAPLHQMEAVITSTERALQEGWIARGPNNRLIPGPGDIEVVRDAQGNIVQITTAQRATRPARPKPTIIITADTTESSPGNEGATVLSEVYILADLQDGRPPLEFRAQRAVVFGTIPQEKGAATTTAPSTNLTTKTGAVSGGAAPTTGTATATTGATARTSPAATGSAPARRDITQNVSGVYLEGDVTLQQGEQVTVRAERIYYDFTSRRAIMLDATLSTVDTKREIPIYMRASEIRQEARGEWAAKNVQFSTSEFYTPHYHIGASEIYLRDVSPELGAPSGGATPGGGTDLGLNAGNFAEKTYQYEIKDATLDVGGLPIFYWPYLAGDTAKSEIPLRTARVSTSKTYGLSLLTDWDLFALAGQPAPDGVKADLNLDYFGKRGPAGGVESVWTTEEDHGLLHSYILQDHGEDRLGTAREHITPTQDTRGWISARDQRDLGDGWKLQLEGTYISDPTFMEQFQRNIFATGKEQETSFYLKKQGENDSISLLGKFNLMDFTTTAGLIDDQFTTEKEPEFKYWRIGDSLLDVFTYYSETSVSNLHMDITDYTPDQLGLQPDFLGAPASVVAKNILDDIQPLKDAKIKNALEQELTFRDYYKNYLKWTTSNVVRGDTRHELDMPLQLGDLKITPYVAGRVTAWDTGFPNGDKDTPEDLFIRDSEDSSTTRLWGGGGVRSAMQFWKVYDDVESTFFDVHRLRHVIEPQFNVFAGGSTIQRGDLQPFDRDVEGISTASGTQLAINQKWQTKRGGEGHWRNVDWIVLNLSWNQFYNKDKTNDNNLFYPSVPGLTYAPVRGMYYMSRPELSLEQDSFAGDWVWRAGERVRFMGDFNYSLESNRLEQASAGMAIDQSKTLSYFIGSRYIQLLNTNELTFGIDYHLTSKYELILTESYDLRPGSGQSGKNILTSVTLARKLPRATAAFSVTYDANNADTTFMGMIYPEAFPQAGIGNMKGTQLEGRSQE